MPAATDRRPTRGLAALFAFVLLAAGAPASALAVAPSDAPALVSPAPGATVGSNPIFYWGSVSGAVKYRVQVSTSETFGTLAYAVDTYNRRATPPSDLPLGPLYWRVAGMDASSNLGPYSPAQGFTKQWAGAPGLISPADSATLSFPWQPPLFSWQPLAGAKSYTLQIDDADDFIGAAAYTTLNTSYTLTEPQTVGQAFYWRVQATSSTTGVVSAWSMTRSYTIGWSTVPTLVTPANTTLTSIEDVNFSWNPVPGAATYQLQVSPNGDWANNIALDVIVKGTRYSPPVGLNNGSFFWRVRARDAKSTPNNGGWSAEWQFTRGWSDRPTLLTPTNGNNNVQAPTFSWTPVDHAAYYELNVGIDPNFSLAYASCFTNHTQLTPYSGCTLGPLIPGTTYYWRVRGVDSPNKVDNNAPALGLWSNTSSSDVFSFTFKPAIPDPTSPSDGATVSTPVLTWAPVDGIGKYRVTIKKSGGAMAATADTYANSYTPTGTLNPADGPFGWYVQTIDANGKLGLIPPSGDWWHFSLTAPATTYATPDLLTPSDGASSNRMPSMTWQDVTGASYYKVFYGVDGSEVAVPLSGTTKLKFAGFTYAAATLAPGTYFWYVEAYDSSDSFIGISTAEQTFTIEAFNVATYASPPKCTPLPPSCAALADTPALTWNDVPGAGGYIVYVAVDANFTNIKAQYWTIYTTLTPRESYLDNQAGQAYYWFVRPCMQGQTGPCGPYDTSVFPGAYAFKKRSAPIDLTWPPEGATVANQVTFGWRDFLATNGALSPTVTQEAMQYRIQVSTVADFATILDTATVDQLTYTPFSLTYPEGPLYWRVQALDGSGNTLTFSNVHSLVKSSPLVAPTYPADGATATGVPYFQWAVQLFAAQYNVEVYKNGDLLFSPANRVLTQTTKMAAWSPTTALAAGDYAWRVRRLDADGRVGPWSAGRTFHLQPAAPTLLWPANGTTFRDDNLIFQWSSVARAVKYRFEASTSPTFSSTYESQDTVMTSWAPTKRYADGAYNWRVKVLDAANNVVATSSIRSFAKDSTRPTVTANAPISSASITGPFTVSFSESVKGVSTTSFKMVIAGTATSIAGSVTPASTTATTNATFVPTRPLVPGQSYTLSLTTGILDLAGNPLVPFSWTVRTALTVENTSPALVEVWDRDSNASASGGIYDASRTPASKAVFTFNGTNVTLVGRRAADGGYADVYLDGVKQNVSPISFYNAAAQWQVTMWTTSGLASTAHALDVRVLGSKPAASANSWVYVDAFTVGAVSFEEGNPAVREQFGRVSTASASGGSYDVTSHVADTDPNKPYYLLTFKGTGVDWYATKTPSSGQARVYIDGADRGAIDLYAASITYGAKVYSSPTLSDGMHTLRIVITGTKRAAATGTDVSLDRILAR